MDVGGRVDHLVDRDQDEVDGHHLRHRPQAGHGGPDGGPDDDLLGDRRIQYPALPELLVESAGHLEGAVVEPDVLAQQEDLLVPDHLLAQRLVQGLSNVEDWHQPASSSA